MLNPTLSPFYFKMLQQLNLTSELIESFLVFLIIAGVGSQFLALATGILVMALFGMFNVHRHGSINSAAVVLYALTSGNHCKPSVSNLIG